MPPMTIGKMRSLGIQSFLIGKVRAGYGKCSTGLVLQTPLWIGSTFIHRLLMQIYTTFTLTLLMMVWTRVAEGSEKLLINEPMGTNMLFMTYDKLELAPEKRRSLTTGEQIVATRGAVDYWRYRLYLGDKDRSPKMILWERTFKNIARTRDTNQIEIFAYHVNPSLDRTIVVSRNYDKIYADICQPGKQHPTHILADHAARLHPPENPGERIPVAFASIGSNQLSGTCEVRLTLRDGRDINFELSGSGWIPKADAKGLEILKSQTNQGLREKIVFDRPYGTNRIVFGFSQLDPANGLRIVTELLRGKTIKGKPVPFDRVYRLTVKSSNPEMDLVIWERAFRCDLFNGPGSRIRRMNSIGVEPPDTDSKNDPVAVDLLGYYANRESPEAVIVYSILGEVTGEIAKVGINSATARSDAKLFHVNSSAVGSGPAATAVTISPGGAAGTYQAMVTLNTGIITNIVFDGLKWIPARIELK